MLSERAQLRRETRCRAVVRPPLLPRSCVSAPGTTRRHLKYHVLLPGLCTNFQQRRTLPVSSSPFSWLRHPPCRPQLGGHLPQGAFPAPPIWMGPHRPVPVSSASIKPLPGRQHSVCEVTRQCLAQSNLWGAGAAPSAQALPSEAARPAHAECGLGALLLLLAKNPPGIRRLPV